MKKCQNEEYIAIITGKLLVMNEQLTGQLFVFKKTPCDTIQGYRYEFHKNL